MRAQSIGLSTLAALLAFGFGCGEELASKTEWSVVQAVEAEHRGAQSREIQFATMTAFSLVGIPVTDARKWVWVLLNPRKPPFYKQLPAGNYSLTKEEIRTILARGDVSSTIAACLDSHVGEGK